MSKADLKTAMDALKVNVPLRLHKSFAFKAPTPLSEPDVAQIQPEFSKEHQDIIKKDSLDSRVTQEMEPTQEIKVGLESRLTQEVEAAPRSRPRQESEGGLDFNPTQISVPSEESKVSWNSEATQKTEPTSESRVTQNFRPTLNTRATSENHKPSKRQLVVQNNKGELMTVNKKDLSAIELVKHLRLNDEGYGALSNRILEILFQADFDKAEHELLEFIIRESIFWRQEWTDPLSAGEFETLSGVSNSSLWTHLKRLTDKHWVEKELFKTNGKGQAKNRYRLNPTVWGPLLPRKKKDTLDCRASQETEGAQDSIPEPTQESRATSQSEIQSGSSLYEKQLLKTDLKTSLSQAPELLAQRWEKMPDRGKSEREIFLNLLETFGRPVWDHCGEVVDYLKEHGDLRKRPVGSPFGLLGQSNNWEIFLGLTLAKKGKEEALRRAREVQIQPPKREEPGVQADDPSPGPSAGFLNFLSKRRGPDGPMNVFQGQFADMEAAFIRRFPCQTTQWAEINAQLGQIANEIENKRAKWITGIQRWFRGAWDRGEIK